MLKSRIMLEVKVGDKIAIDGKEYETVSMRESAEWRPEIVLERVKK